MYLFVAQLTEGNGVMRVVSTMQMMSVLRFRAAGPATVVRCYSNFDHRSSQRALRGTAERSRAPCLFIREIHAAQRQMPVAAGRTHRPGAQSGVSHVRRCVRAASVRSV